MALVHIIHGGENYSALADGLQSALCELGGTPKEHRTDSLSAAYVNAAQQQSLTERYQALCEHYSMKPTVNNPGVSHENGAIEAPHGSLKRRIAQALKLRGNSDFASESDYRRFIESIVERLNKKPTYRNSIRPNRRASQHNMTKPDWITVGW